MEDVLVPLIVFASIFGVIYVFLTTRNKERMALIEKGADAKLFSTGKSYNFKNFSLSLGMFLIGIGLGIIGGAILQAKTLIDPGAAYSMSIFFFAGLSLVVYFFIDRKLNKENA